MGDNENWAPGKASGSRQDRSPLRNKTPSRDDLAFSLNQIEFYGARSRDGWSSPEAGVNNDIVYFRNALYSSVAAFHAAEWNEFLTEIKSGRIPKSTDFVEITDLPDGGMRFFDRLRLDWNSTFEFDATGWRDFVTDARNGLFDIENIKPTPTIGPIEISLPRSNTREPIEEERERDPWTQEDPWAQGSDPWMQAEDPWAQEPDPWRSPSPWENDGPNWDDGFGMSM